MTLGVLIVLIILLIFTPEIYLLAFGLAALAICAFVDFACMLTGKYFDDEQ